MFQILQTLSMIEISSDDDTQLFCQVPTESFLLTANVEANFDQQCNFSGHIVGANHTLRLMRPVFMEIDGAMFQDLTLRLESSFATSANNLTFHNVLTIHSDSPFIEGLIQYSAFQNSSFRGKDKFNQQSVQNLFSGCYFNYSFQMMESSRNDTVESCYFNFTLSSVTPSMAGFSGDASYLKMRFSKINCRSSELNIQQNNFQFACFSVYLQHSSLENVYIRADLKLVVETINSSIGVLSAHLLNSKVHQIDVLATVDLKITADKFNKKLLNVSGFCGRIHDSEVIDGSISVFGQVIFVSRSDQFIFGQIAAYAQTARFSNLTIFNNLTGTNIGRIGSVAYSSSNSFVRIGVYGNITTNVCYYVGGIAGLSVNTNITSSFTQMTFSSINGSTFGGIVGQANNSVILYSISIADIIIDTDLPAMVGILFGRLVRSVVTNVQGLGKIVGKGNQGDFGGLSGEVTASTVRNSMISNVTIQVVSKRNDVVQNVGSFSGYAQNLTVDSMNTQAYLIVAGSGGKMVGGFIGLLNHFNQESSFKNIFSRCDLDCPSCGGDTGAFIGVGSYDTQFNMSIVLNQIVVATSYSQNDLNLIGNDQLLNKVEVEILQDCTLNGINDNVTACYDELKSSSPITEQKLDSNNWIYKKGINDDYVFVKEAPMITFQNGHIIFVKESNCITKEYFYIDSQKIFPLFQRNDFCRGTCFGTFVSPVNISCIKGQQDDIVVCQNYSAIDLYFNNKDMWKCKQNQNLLNGNCVDCSNCNGVCVDGRCYSDLELNSKTLQQFIITSSCVLAVVIVICGLFYYVLVKKRNNVTYTRIVI